MCVCIYMMQQMGKIEAPGTEVAKNNVLTETSKSCFLTSDVLVGYSGTLHMFGNTLLLGNQSRMQMTLLLILAWTYSTRGLVRSILEGREPGILKNIGSHN